MSALSSDPWSHDPQTCPAFFLALGLSGWFLHVAKLSQVAAGVVLVASVNHRSYLLSARQQPYGILMSSGIVTSSLPIPEHGVRALGQRTVQKWEQWLEPLLCLGTWAGKRDVGGCP